MNFTEFLFKAFLKRLELSDALARGFVRDGENPQNLRLVGGNGKG
jgi:hypothetical protein